jgi:hypothetical protein
VNTSVNSAGDQVLWYNYSIQTPTRFVANGNYDYLVFKSQVQGKPIAPMLPPDFEASATSYQTVTEGYEFDAFIGADDGSNQLILGANATMQVKYCSLAPYCTPTSFAYSNVPAAVNYGSQTGEQAIGVAVSYMGTTAYLSGGPVIEHGLWNYTDTIGVGPGATKVTNGITVSGSPLPVTTQPYFFVFFENTNYTEQGFQWAPDVPAWFLMPGTYNYQIMLADYVQQNGTITVGLSPVTLTATLPYDSAMGVYTPLWAFGNDQLAGISLTGSGTLSSQYVPFANPTTGYFGFTPDNLSSVFYSMDDYSFASFSGVLLEGIHAYVDLNSLPSFCVGASGGSNYDLGIELFETSNVTLSHDADVQGWPEWSEIGFYVDVPPSQNPAPQADVYVWNSTNDLITSNTFVGTSPQSSSTAPDELVLYGGHDNVVWGNTFLDPPGLPPDGTYYAGIGLGESGDTIYNNNFSVDNPIVFLPYNWPNVADCLPMSLGGCINNATGNGWFYNTAANVEGNGWNVTLQPASAVTMTVNGFPLSGNILGPNVTTQGGNYYWNYGTSPNNYSASPYVDRFFYSDWSNIFPLGCVSIQAPEAPCGTQPPLFGAYQDGITAGGDYAPYGPMAVFIETGLPSGAEWAVDINGTNTTTSSSSVSILEPYGQHSYAISALKSEYTVTPSSGEFFANGAPVIHVRFLSKGQAPTISSFTASPKTIPLGGTTFLNVTATGGASPYTYLYGGLPSGCTTSNVSNLPCAPSSPGNYSVTVTVTGTNGMSTTSSLVSFNVSKQPVQTPTLSGVTVAVSSPGVIEGGSVNLTATPVCTDGICPAGTAYMWSSTAMGTLNSTVGPAVRFTAGNVSGTVTLMVKATLNGVTKFANASLTIEVGRGNTGPGGGSVNTYYILAIIIAIAALCLVVGYVFWSRRSKMKPAEEKAGDSDTKDTEPGTSESSTPPEG